ncbi:MAG: response regulator transcription factor [Motilibacteraceae bacterium]
MVEQLSLRGLHARDLPLASWQKAGEAAVDVTTPVLVLAHELTLEQAEVLRDWLTGRPHVILGEPRQLAARGALHGLRAATASSLDELVHLLQRARPALGPARSLPVPSTAQLTSRELDVLRLIARGAGNTEIAGELAISSHTVRTHTQNILGKLGVSNRFAAVAMARSAGMLEPARSR